MGYAVLAHAEPRVFAGREGLGTAQPVTIFLAIYRQAEIRGDWQFEKVGSQKTRGKEQDFEILDLASCGIQPGHYRIPELFRFLFGIRRPFVDVENVPFAVVAKRQLRFHSTTPSVNFLAM